MPTYDELCLEIAALEARLPTDREAAVTGLRRRLEAAALARLGAAPGTPALAAARAAATSGVRAEDAQAAARLLARAEAIEVEIGRWASGPGEGLVSRMSACELKLAQAWLRLVSGTDGRAAVEALVEAVAREPNGVGARLAPACAALLHARGGGSP